MCGHFGHSGIGADAFERIIVLIGGSVPHLAGELAVRFQPCAQCGSNLNQPAAGFLCGGSSDLDESRLKVHIAPVEALDLSSTDTTEKPDGERGQDFGPSARRSKDGGRIGNGQGIRHALL